MLLDVCDASCIVACAAAILDQLPSPFSGPIPILVSSSYLYYIFRFCFLPIFGSLLGICFLDFSFVFLYFVFT